MRKSYHYTYKYLILHIVLSFIHSNNNKYFVKSQKVRNKMISVEENPNDILCQNGRAINLTDSSIFCNHTALPQKSDPEEEEEEEKDKRSHGVTCYTCVNVSDNHICNKYAIDQPCKSGNDFCHTLHIMDPKGRSILVNKKCANETECTPHAIGCYYIDNQKICISCCDEDYCNKKVPTQASNATFKNSRTFRQKPPKSNGKGNGPGTEENLNRSERNGTGKTLFRFIAHNSIQYIVCYLFRKMFAFH